MTNPFKKEDNTALIAAMLIGGIAAAGLAYLYLTDDGGEFRGQLKRNLKERGKNMAANAINRKTGIPKKLVKKAASAVL
jgi:hypothetical protein